MLIVLESNDDKDASDFTNFFRENVQFQPNSDIALINVSYAFDLSVNIPSGFKYSIGAGTDRVTTDIDVLEGQYTQATFLDELRRGLLAYFDGLEYWQTRSFPSDKQIWSFTGETVRLTLQYDPEDFAAALAKCEAGAFYKNKSCQILLSDSAMMTAGTGGLVENSSTVLGLGESFFASALSNSVLNMIWGSALNNDTPDPNGATKFRPQQNDAAMVFGAELGLSDYDDANFMEFYFDLADNGTFVIRENINGVMTAVTPAIDYVAFNTFEIRFRRKIAGFPNPPFYFYNGKAIQDFISSDRYEISPEDKLIINSSFNTPKTTGKVVGGIGSTLSSTVWNIDSISTPGLGYEYGDVCTCTNANNKICTLRVTSVNSTGGVLGVEILTHADSLNPAGETLDLVKGIPTDTGTATIVFNNLNSAFISTVGTGYNTGLADLVIGGVTVPNALTVALATDATSVMAIDFGNSGKVTSVNVTFGGSGYAVGDTGTIIPDSGFPFTNRATFDVVSETGGAITLLNITSGGLYYSIDDTCTLQNDAGGGGSGCTLSILTVQEDAFGSGYTNSTIEMKRDGMITDFATGTTDGSGSFTVTAGTGLGFAVGDFIEVFQPSVASGLPADKAFGKITAVGGGISISSTWDDALVNQITAGSVLTVSQSSNTSSTITINAVNKTLPSMVDVQWTTIPENEIDTPFAKHADMEFEPNTTFSEYTGLLPDSTDDASTALVITGSKPITSTRQSNLALIHLEEATISGICKQGGIQKIVGSVPLGATSPVYTTDTTPTEMLDGRYYYEPYNVLRHDLKNTHVSNHNQLRIRLTDAVGVPLTLKHPTTVTLDVSPRAK